MADSSLEKILCLAKSSASSHAMSDGSFHIHGTDDLYKAVSAHDMAPPKKRKQIRAHITKRASDLKANYAIPTAWFGMDGSQNCDPEDAADHGVDEATENH